MTTRLRRAMPAILLAWGIAGPFLQAGSFRVIHDFGGSPVGTLPLAGLIMDSAGNLYGTTAYGGNDNNGVVFKIDAAGNYTLLHGFHGSDGAVPMAGLIMDQADNLYGTASAGGQSHHGVIFKIDTAGAYSVLYNFTGTDGSSPQAALMMDSAGNFYGTTVEGGASGKGTVFELNATGAETVLYSFTGGDDGSEPYANLIQDAAGNLYGTTRKGGASYKGTVFKLGANGQETVLHSFAGQQVDGANPLNGLIMDAAGNLYGATAFGGPYVAPVDAVGGVIFKLDPSGNETILYNFSYDAGGDTPLGNLIMDSEGNLYGTALAAGNEGCTQELEPYYIFGCGVVFKLSQSGEETVLYSFSNGPGGDGPGGGVIQDAAGNFYGTAEHGGSMDWGVVFKLDTAGNETVLWNFTFEVDGAGPTGLVQDASGNFWGATGNGGTGPCWTPISAGCGVAFELDPKGNQQVLYTFLGGADGSSPVGNVAPDGEGNVYGVTSAGGDPACSCGVIYKVDTQGNETVLHTFTGTSDGGKPAFGLVRDSGGNLYGTASSNLFKVDPSGKFSVIYQFTGGNDGYASGALMLDAAGNIYAPASGGKDNQGLIFELDTSGKFTVLHEFTGSKKDEGQPQGPLAFDSAGNIYGTTGFNSEIGSVFELDTAGQVTILYNFTEDENGWDPNGGLVIDAAGNIYGTTLLSGTLFDGGDGIVFKLDTSGNFTMLHNFDNFSGGDQPVTLFIGSSGGLYGATSIGGSSLCVYGCGVVFKLEP